MGNESAKWRVKWNVAKRLGDINQCASPEERLKWLENTKPYDIVKGEGNCLLNTGIDEIWDLVTGAVSGNDHIFDNTYARIGVGDSATAAAAAQTDLQAASNKQYNAMEAGFPTSTSQQVTFKASFGSSEANYAWNEWVVKQATSGISLNRKVDSMGTKASGSTWTLEVTITLS